MWGCLKIHFIYQNAKFYLAFLLLFLLSLHSHAQNAALLAQAQSAQAEGKMAEALRAYLQYLPEVKTKPAQKAEVELAIAKLYKEWQVYEKAIPFLHNAQAFKKFDDKTRFYILKSLSEAHYERVRKSESADSAFHFARQAITFARKQEMQAEYIESLQYYIKILKEREKYADAILISRSLVHTLRRQEDSSQLAVALNNLGYLYRFRNAMDTALLTFNEVFDLEQQLQASASDRIITLINIGVLHQNQQNYSASLAFLEEGLRLTEGASGDTLLAQRANLQNLIARVHLTTGNFPEAERYGLQAVRTARKNALPTQLKDACLTLSGTYRANYDYKMALNYFEEHAELADSLRRQAEREAKAAAAQRSSANDLEKEVRLLLVDKEIKALQVEKFQLQAAKSEQELALIRQKSQLDSAAFQRKQLENAQRLQTLTLRQRELEAEQQANQIIDLQREQELKDLELEQKELREKERLKELELANAAKKQLEQEAEIKNLQLEDEKNIRNFYTLIIILGSAIFLLVLWGFVQNRKKNKLLSEQKEEIEVTNEELAQRQDEILAQSATLQQAFEEIQTKNEFLEEQKQTIEEKNLKITDSINYAQRIQEAMLPPAGFLAKQIPDSFIFFRPRDVVSGDFYWFAEYQNHLIMAAVDCTGHGVPGAFMSMLGSHALQSLINERGILEPSEILDGMHKEVREALSQDISNNRDGMDAALVILSPDKKTLRYAGAHNPFLYIQNGEMHRIKATNRAIGGATKTKKTAQFTTHEIAVQDGLSGYLYSDGFQDQFGGEKGRKFMSKKFRNLLFEIHELPMKEQDIKLSRTLADWKGSREQVDDILIIGFKL